MAFATDIQDAAVSMGAKAVAIASYKCQKNVKFFNSHPSTLKVRPRMFIASRTPAFLLTTALVACCLPLSHANAQACSNRGELDEKYCDANRDLVADTPTATSNPSKLVLAISSVEDANTARRTYFPLMDYLATCLKKEVEMYPPTREGAVLEAQRNNIAHIGQYTTGGMMYAVNFAGAIPFAGKGHDNAGHSDNYVLKLLVRADSPFKQPIELKGKRIAHTTMTSNSGNQAPRALFPELGLKPDVDYKVEFSGGHDKSIMGVKMGLYDAAAIASDVMERMIAKGEIKASDFHVLYQSDPFPTDGFAFSNTLDPKLQAQIRKCFVDFQFPESMRKQLEGNNRFFPLEYKKDWSVVRLIAKAAGNPPNKANYQKILEKK